MEIATWKSHGSAFGQRRLRTAMGILFMLALCGCGGHTALVQAPKSPVLADEWRGGLVGVWHPPRGLSRGSIILHQGHNCFKDCLDGTASLVPLAERFAAAGYVVYGMEMPPEPHDGRPITDFLEPVTRLLDRTGPAYMIGLSGGGWTTAVVTASNPRIIRGYSVAGDAPVDVWPGLRDWEQLMFDYRSLYALAGKRLQHFYNFHDPCCFYGIEGDVGYPYVSDVENHQHRISDWVADQIFVDIETSH